MRTRTLDRWRRWLGLALLLVVAPKCLACLFAWLGLAAWLGFGPELCGGPVP